MRKALPARLRHHAAMDRIARRHRNAIAENDRHRVHTAHAGWHVGDGSDDPELAVRRPLDRARTDELRQPHLARQHLVWLDPHAGDDLPWIDRHQSARPVARCFAPYDGIEPARQRGGAEPALLSVPDGSATRAVDYALMTVSGSRPSARRTVATAALALEPSLDEYCVQRPRWIVTLLGGRPTTPDADGTPPMDGAPTGRRCCRR